MHAWNAPRLALAAILAAGCGSTQPWDIWHDGHWESDTIPDPTRDPGFDAPADTPADVPAEDVAPELPPGACEEICAFLVECGRSGTNCMEGCERSSEALRLCLLEAAAAADCEAIDPCYASIPEPPECDPVCEFAQSCTYIMPIDICEDSCTLMSSDVLACATSAMEADDCAELVDCILYPGGTEEQCDAVCSFAIDECAIDLGVDVALCSLGCQSGFLIEEGLLDCLGYAAALRSCLLLYGCVALYLPAP